MTLGINSTFTFFGLIAWWVVFCVLSLTAHNEGQVLAIFGFLTLIIVPGLVTLLALKIRDLGFWITLTLCISLSLLMLMLIGLFANTVLPLFDIPEPLQAVPLIAVSSVFVLGMCVYNWLSSARITLLIHTYETGDNIRNLLLAFLPALLVPLSVFGAIRLNNGGDGSIALFMLFCAAAYAIFLMLQRKKLDENVIPIALYFIGLSLLLMTSLRGNFITGHDIQREFYVFQLAKMASLWSIDAYQDAYNACLSITILPVLFSRLLSISDPYIYKVLYQILFALCPPLVYLTCRRWFSSRLSFLGALYFVSFPTFFEDMPFLNRQEIAFIFFGLLAYLLFDNKLPEKTRKYVVALLGAGIVLSHYSTTYTVIAIFGLTAIATPILRTVMRYFSGSYLRESGLAIERDVTSRPRITASIVAILIAMTLVWTVVVTHTAGNFSAVVAKTVSAIGNGFTENSRSIDAVSLFTTRRPDSQAVIADFVNTKVPELRQKDVGLYTSSPSLDEFYPKVVAEPKLGKTSFGQILEKVVPIYEIVPFVGQLVARIVEIFTVLGLVYILYRRDVFHMMEFEYYVLAGSCLFFVLVNAVVPVLSTEYGVFRALEQAMFVVAPFIILGSVLFGNTVAYVVNKIHMHVNGATEPLLRHGHEFIPAVLGILFFLYGVAAVPQLVGGNVPRLHLNNDGFYYYNYVTNKNEVQAVMWLASTTGAIYDEQTTPVVASRFAKNKMAAITDLLIESDIYPSLLRNDSFIFVDTPQIEKGRAPLYYQGIVVDYEYPLQSLDKSRDRIYDNSRIQIYR